MQAGERARAAPAWVSPFLGHIGLEIESMADGRARAILPLRRELLNSLGIAHGGVIATLLDTVAGAAAYSTLAPDQISVTSDLNISYLGNVSCNALVCEAEVYHRGASLVRAEARVFADGVLLARANVSFVIRRRDLLGPDAQV